jgi:ELWxxDGT repeat protein
MKNFTQCMKHQFVDNLKRGAGWLMMVFIFSGFSVYAQETLVKDINPSFSPDDSEPSGYVEKDGFVFFSATTFHNGKGLWKTDGTTAGTQMMKSINDFSGADINGTLYVSADDGTHGKEFWKSDGTAAGTVMVKDINPGAASSYAGGFFLFNDMIFFSATDEIHGWELWRTDGTEEGTTLVKDILPGFQSGMVDYFTIYKGSFYFTARGSNGNFEIWKTDGTDGGTQKVVTAPGSISGLTVYNDMMFFNANNSIWKTDGTMAGSSVVKAVKANYLTVVNGTLFFRGNDGTSGGELWKSDGTEMGTMMVKDIFVGTNGSEPSDLIAFNNTLYFSGGNDISGYELWRSDGTEAGTFVVKDIWPGNSSTPQFLTRGGDHLYFVANDGTTGYELWKTDGTEEGTALVKDISVGNTNPHHLTFINDKLFFSARTITNGVEPWTSDGTEAGTIMVKDINAQPHSGYPDGITNANGTIFFSADDGVNGDELWRTNAGEKDAEMIADIFPGSESSDIADIVSIGNNILFRANDGEHGTELWRSDGSKAGTVMVKDIMPGTSGSYTGNRGDFFNFDGTLYFSAADDIHGFELWKSDGTAEGTVMVKDIHSAGWSSPRDFYNANGTLYFRAYNGTDGGILWKTDGTAEGTVQIKSSTVNSWEDLPMAHIGNTLYFTSRDYAGNSELWKTDGTPQSTRLVKHFNSTETIFTLINVNGTLFLNANDGSNGRELWKSNGTEEGTTIVKDIFPGSNSSNPYYFYSHGGLLYFSANDGTHDYELWKSDGTQKGTTLVKDIHPGGEASDVSDFLSIGNTLYFTADDGVHGRQLWRTNGLECSTVAVTSESEIELGPEIPLIENNGLIYFWGMSIAYGAELFFYDTHNDKPGCGQIITFNELPSKTYGDAPLSLDASSSSGLQVEFSSNNTQVATIVNNTLTIVGPGIATITASQPGDNIYLAAEPVQQILGVNKALQTITFSELADKTFGDAPFSLAATATSGLPVSYVSSHPEIASISDNIVTIHKPGKIAIAANQEGNENYEAATQVPQILTILKHLQSITFAELPVKTLGEVPFTLSATANSGLPVTFESSDHTIATVTGNAVTIVGAGTTTITASQSGDEQFDEALAVQQVLTIQLVTDLETPGGTHVQFYPNPVNDVLNIRGISSQQVKTEVLDAMGRIVAGETASVSDEDLITLDVSHLKPGIYCLRIRTHKEIVSAQIVKK